MKNRIFSGAPAEDFAGFARAVIDMERIYVSGTLGDDPESGDLPDEVAAQTRNALSAIDETLVQAGASIRNVVQARVYLTDAAYLGAVASVLGDVFGDIRPTNTLVVCQIPRPGAKVEIEVTASIAKG
ncbi:Rid family hydrolase [Lentibacter sp. XHP0401]|uniref:Rid family hydrolase n=1 Tax=Lentibacter sp. XHP0401 TaxID=2984334 RepID=UPI0021E980A6|nr:Rid family hydrolase [Lentibacter sp. XHP0401]MCV2894645.1 Rid family hydrolase [Lentibacter sp. XHP0401]